MNILYAASPQIAVPCLNLLLQAGSPWTLVGLLTSPPASRGRHRALNPSDVAQALDMAGAEVPVLSPEHLLADARNEIARLSPDLLIAFAYGRIFGPKFLELFPRGAINIHPSLLPKYRGATPIPEAILHRDRQTGISIQKIAREMDSGDLLLQEKMDIVDGESTASLTAKVSLAAVPLLEKVLRSLANFPSVADVPAQKQDHRLATYCRKIEKEDGQIDWSQRAVDIDAMVRAYQPWPLAHTYWQGQRLNIFQAQAQSGTENSDIQQFRAGQVLGIDRERGILVKTGEGILAIRTLQLAGRKILDWKTFLNGAREFPSAFLE